MAKKLEKLLFALEKEAKVVKRRLEENKETFNEVSKSSRTSWSAAGERDYAEDQAEIIKRYYEKVMIIKEQVEISLKHGLPERIRTPGYVLAEVSGEKIEFFVVEEPVNLSGFRLVSKDSPLGVVVVGKKAGDKFSYEVNRKKVKGRVLKHE